MSRAGDDWRGAAAVSGALAMLYVWLRCPSFGPGDSPQHVLSALTFSVSRPPGYPLYVAAGWLFSRLWPGSPEAAASAVSGLCQAGASGFFFLALRRLRCGRPAALTATALLSLSPLFWYYAEIAEVRALNNLLACAAAYYTLAWREERRPARLNALGVIMGLGLSHHPTFALILPPLAWMLWRGRIGRGETARLTAIALAATLAPYALLWLRLRLGTPPVYNPNDTRTLADVLALLLRRDSGGLLRIWPGQGLSASGRFEAGPLLLQARWFGAWLVRDVNGSAAALAALALAAAARERRGREAPAFWLFWLAAAAGPYLLVSSQQVPSRDAYYQALSARFYLLPQIGLFGLAGLGAELLARRVRPALARALPAAALAAPLLLRPLDLRRHQPLRGYAEDLLRATGPRDMIVLAADDTIFAMFYFERALARTGERVFLHPTMFHAPVYLRQLRARHPGLRVPVGPEGLRLDWADWLRLNPGRRLFIENTRLDTVVGKSLRVAPVGALAEILPRAARAPDPAREAARFLADSALSRLSSQDVYPFTQECYLLQVARRQLDWYGSLLQERRPVPAALLDALRRRRVALL